MSESAMNKINMSLLFVYGITVVLTTVLAVLQP